MLNKESGNQYIPLLKIVLIKVLKNNTAPIGIFDSGIGGLTVAKAVMKALPAEDIIYFGDTARVPYGIKSEKVVRSYALEITKFLLKKGVKIILIACNTVSASAKKEISELAGNIPVLDVISAGAAMAVDHQRNNKVGVIGTLGTVRSNAYKKAINEFDRTIEIVQKACPMLVPLAEEGWIDNDIAKKTIEEYLSEFKMTDIDSLILGCTHYPLFKSTIRAFFNDDHIYIIDSAESIAESAFNTLKNLQIENKNGGSFECFVSDQPQRFHELAKRFLGRKINRMEIVTLN